MSDYASNIDLPAAAAWLLAGERFTLLTHAKPDGDAWGSVVALAAALNSLGKQVTAAFAPPVPAALAELPGHELTITLETASETSPLERGQGEGGCSEVCFDQCARDNSALTPTLSQGERGLRNSHLGNRNKLPEAVDRVVLLDTGAWSQCEPFAGYLKANLKRTLIIDHHRSGDIEAPHRYIEPEAAATCEILADLLPHLTRNPIPDTRNPIFVGISTDTGFFRFSNTSPRTLRLAADLIEQGVDSAAMYEQLELCERREKLELTRRALDSLHWVAGGCAALMTLRLSDFEQSGALEEESERLVNIPLQVAAARVSALLCEKRNEQGVICRLSLRSKSTGRTVDVSQLAGQFGGGGHMRASGARIDAPLDAALPQVIAALDRAL
ncbi:MAG: DHH family phosphoesterase [Phycisphaeraceae bacterium]|nr:DHH family phosphoesterase [Phycisphaeraceae bacterium]